MVYELSQVQRDEGAAPFFAQKSGETLRLLRPKPDDTSVLVEFALNEFIGRNPYTADFGTFKSSRVISRLR